ncbi:hypothetical protein OIO90_000940 [Microbotryomycetes sp. JL221]|nr:hypothetical protein OIO90_000940 [Microbotryomycetes sp. JL221]
MAPSETSNVTPAASENGDGEASTSTCEPLARSKRPRPTHSKIEELEQERDTLHNFLRGLASATKEEQARKLEHWLQTGNLASSPAHATTRATPTAVSPAMPGTTASAHMSDSHASQDPVSRLHIDSTSGHATSHGPTSAFFDETVASTTQAGADKGHASISDAEIKSRLVTFCAEQRHQEMIALALGTLDFDGVQPELAMHLLALHWNRQHHAFLITYRPLFMRDMACGGPYFSKLLLNAIYFSVAKFSKRPEVFDDVNDPRTAGMRFLRRVKELLGESLDRSRIPTIQALLLLSSSLFALGWQSGPWIYSGVAFRMLTDLGLLHDWKHKVVAGGEFEPADLEIRRRLVWAAFVFDKIISLYQGRAVTLHEFDLKVPAVFLDHYEEAEPWTPFAFPSTGSYTSSPSYSVSTFTELCSLSVLMGRIISTFYADHTCPDPLQQLAAFNASLAEWSERLPPFLRFDAADLAQSTPPPHVLSLYSRQSALPRGHLQALRAPVASECWRRCESAATKATYILTRYRETYTLSRAPYLIAYGTYIAATIMVRTAAQKGPSSDATRCLKICIEGLKENADVNTGARKTLKIVEGLVQRLNVALSDDTERLGPSTHNGDEAAPVDIANGGVDVSATTIDIDAIMSSFNFNQDMFAPVQQQQLPPQYSQFAANGGFQQDSLFGISLLGFPEGDGTADNWQGYMEPQ